MEEKVLGRSLKFELGTGNQFAVLLDDIDDIPEVG